MSPSIAHTCPTCGLSQDIRERLIESTRLMTRANEAFLACTAERDEAISLLRNFAVACDRGPLYVSIAHLKAVQRLLHVAPGVL